MLALLRLKTVLLPLPPYLKRMQRDPKTGKPIVKNGSPVELTSHTLNPVPCAIGGPGLPPTVRFRCGGGRLP